MDLTSRVTRLAVAAVAAVGLSTLVSGCDHKERLQLKSQMKIYSATYAPGPCSDSSIMLLPEPSAGSPQVALCHEVYSDFSRIGPDDFVGNLYFINAVQRLDDHGLPVVHLHGVPQLLVYDVQELVSTLSFPKEFMVKTDDTSWYAARAFPYVQAMCTKDDEGAHTASLPPRQAINRGYSGSHVYRRVYICSPVYRGDSRSTLKAEITNARDPQGFPVYRVASSP